MSQEKKPLVKRILSPIEAFMQMETSGGIALIIFTIIAMVWANSSYHEGYEHFIHTPLGFSIGDYLVQKSLLHWVNDGLMAIFFFVVGLEIKKELVVGELSTPKKAALPILAAVGGMVVPAAIYAMFNTEGVAQKGWGIPMATDIAFAIGILSLMGKRAPFSLKIFLLALAIVDDLGAILVIAFFYTSEISSSALNISFASLILIFFLGKSGIRSKFVYFIIGIVAWFALLKSGIHATIAGVMLGLLTPARPWYKTEDIPEKINKLSKGLTAALTDDIEDKELHSDSKAYLHELHHLSSESESPLDTIVHALHPWVSFFIMPFFALVNAGVSLKGVQMSDLFTSTVSLGIVLGLFVGKPLGIVGICFIAVKLKLAELPKSINWGHITAAGFLGGIGFTMALFVSGLAFGGASIEVFSKMGILTASVLSSVVGCLALFFFTSSNKS